MHRDKWDQRYAAEALVWSVEPNCFVVAETADLSPGRAIDIASGEGRNAIWLAERGWAVTAVDFSRVAMDKARQLAHARGVEVEWVLDDVTTFEPPRSHFELVLICYLQVPASDRRTVLMHARRALVAGGTLLYIAHDASNLEHGYGGPKDPAVLCTPAEVVAELPDLDIVKAEVARREVVTTDDDGEPRTAVALDTLVRAVRPR